MEMSLQERENGLFTLLSRSTDSKVLLSGFPSTRTDGPVFWLDTNPSSKLTGNRLGLCPTRSQDRRFLRMSTPLTGGRVVVLRTGSSVFSSHCFDCNLVYMELRDRFPVFERLFSTIYKKFPVL